MAKINGFKRYLREVRSILERAENEENDKITEVANEIAESLARDKLLHVFGTGHSSLLANELFGRAGGLVPVNLVSDPKLTTESSSGSTLIERKEGVAKEILKKHNISVGEIMIIISTSGRNAVPVEMALEAKKQGLKVVALTSVEYSKKVESRHSSGKKLYQIADFVIDNKAKPGDAVMEIEGFDKKIGPTSGTIGSAILQGLIVRTVEIMIEKGEKPLVWLSANAPRGDEVNAKYKEKYKDRIRFM